MKKICVNDFGKELKKIRLYMSCSQVEFCKRLNISPGTYSAWETGRFLPSINSLTHICDKLYALNVNRLEVKDLRDKYYDLKVKGNED